MLFSFFKENLMLIIFDIKKLAWKSKDFEFKSFLQCRDYDYLLKL